MGGGLFALGAWPAGGVVPDASQAGDRKELGVVGATPPPSSSAAGSKCMRGCVHFQGTSFPVLSEGLDQWCVAVGISDLIELGCVP